jgi:hypothetical protein
MWGAADDIVDGVDPAKATSDAAAATTADAVAPSRAAFE